MEFILVMIVGGAIVIFSLLISFLISFAIRNRKMKLFWDYPGWGWRMYGIGSVKPGKMWFIGFTKQLITS
jgi:uncharacterized membrane protein